MMRRLAKNEIGYFYLVSSKLTKIKVILLTLHLFLALASQKKTKDKTENIVLSYMIRQKTFFCFVFPCVLNIHQSLTGNRFSIVKLLHAVLYFLLLNELNKRFKRQQQNNIQFIPAKGSNHDEYTRWAITFLGHCLYWGT